MLQNKLPAHPWSDATCETCDYWLSRDASDHYITPQGLIPVQNLTPQQRIELSKQAAKTRAAVCFVNPTWTIMPVDGYCGQHRATLSSVERIN